MDSLPTPPFPSAAFVLTDPLLFRRIVSFQAGLPVALHELWVQHEPQAAALASQTAYALCDYMDHIMKVVATHGSPQLAELVIHVNTVTASRRRPHFSHVPIFISARALRSRATVWRWFSGLSPIASSRSISLVDACRHDRNHDRAVLELLHSQSSIPNREFQGCCLTVICDRVDVRLLQWAYEKKPQVVASWARPFITAGAVHGGLATVQYVHEYISEHAIDLAAFELAYTNQRYDVLEYFVQQRAERMDTLRDGRRFQVRLVEDADLAAQTPTKKYARECRLGHLHAVERTVARDDFAQIETWYESGWLTKRAPISIDPMVSAQDPLLAIRFLHDKGFATATTEAMETAAESGVWDVVDFFHEHLRKGCTMRAMDGAVKHGDLARVQFFQDNYQLSFSSEAVA